MSNASPPTLAHPHRILVRGVNWLGDAVMTTPALMRLREARPEARITLLTHEKLADLWTRHPSIDTLLTFAKNESAWSVARKLRLGSFQSGLALPNSHRSALELWLAGIPRRIGCAAPARSWFLTQSVTRRSDFARMRKRSRSEINRLNAAGPGDASIVPSGGGSAAHQLHHYLRLAAALGANPEPLAPYLEVSREEVETARQKFSLRAGALWLALNPGAEYGPAKRWPRERFVEAAAQIQSRANCRWIVLGGANDEQLAATTAGEIGQLTARNSHPAPINLAGRTSLRELCAVLKACRVLLTNDTGPMHVAAAVGTPVVAIFGSTSPNLTGPGLPGDPRHHLLDSHAPCSPCFLRECPIDFRCMRGVPVERVANAVMSALDR